MAKVCQLHVDLSIDYPFISLDSFLQDSNDASSVNVTCIVSKLFNFNEERYEILVKLAEPGYYHCSVKHMDKTLKTIDAIVLTGIHIFLSPPLCLE